MSKEKTINDSEYSLEAVPKKAQVQGLLATMMILVGFTFFSPSMTAGGTLGLGLSMRDFLIALLIGNIFLGIYCGTLAYIGQKTGLTVDLLARRSFGVKGSLLPSVIISFTQIGWFGVGVAMFAIPVSNLLDISTVLLILITGFCFTITAYAGIRVLAIFGAIAVPLIAILGTYSVSLSIDEVGGIANVFSDNPENPLTLPLAVSIVVGTFISGGTATPNFVRFSKSGRNAVFATVVAFFIGNSIMMIFGAVGGAVAGTPDIFDVLIYQGLAVAAVITLGLNIWSTNNNALYTAGLGVSNITKKPMKPYVLIGGAIGTVLATWLYSNFIPYLNLLSAIIPPIGAVLIIDYFMYKEDYMNGSEAEKNVKVSAMIAVGLGSIVGIFLDWGIKPINSLVVAGATFIIIELITKKVKETK